MRSLPKHCEPRVKPPTAAALALLLAYTAALLWTWWADVTFHNKIPIDRFEVHGLYPLSLLVCALVAAALRGRDLGSLALRWPNAGDIVLALTLGLVPPVLCFLANLLLGLTSVRSSPTFDHELLLLGLPITFILALFEESFWRGFLFSVLRERLSAFATSTWIGLAWGLWHYPVILHTRFLYSELAPLHGVIAISVMTLGWGWVAGWLRERSGSLWPPVFWHAATNWIVFTLIQPAEQDISALSPYFRLDQGALYLATGVLIGWGLRKGPLLRRPSLIRR